MQSLFAKLRAKLGDFWFYSLMLFIASRAADVLNVFVGLWLVPKYVDPSELGAVMPLTQFANFLAIPIAVFASTFRNELTTLAVNRRFGQMKTLMRSVFIATGVFLFLAIIVSRLVLPAFLERIRIAEGSLGTLILICAFVGAVSPIYSNALQALKKLKTNTLICLLGAPIRLLAMLATMPFRALSGYFVGQAATPIFNMVAATVGLRRELSVPAEPYWTRDIIHRFIRLFLIFGASAVAGGIYTLVENTVLRQRLSELDSAAYYMVTRFSEIATFLSAALAFTIFPFTAELSTKGKDTRPLIVKASLAVIASNAILIAAYWCFGKQFLAFLPHGDKYAAYWWAMPWLVATTTIGSIMGLYTTSEISAFRFGYLKWWIPLDLLYPAALLFVSGYGYFVAYLPTECVQFLTAHNITSLSTMLWWMTGINLIRLTGCMIAMLKQKPSCIPKSVVLSYPHAQGTGSALHDRQPHDGGGLHSFASRRERALSDLGRVRVLAEAIASQPSGTSDSSPRDSIRKIVDIANSCGLFITVPAASSPRGVVTAATPSGTLQLGELISKRTGESEVYFNAAEHAYYKVKWPSAKAHIKQTSPCDWFYEHIIHNILFSDTAYEFIGITEEVGELKIILRQQEIQSESFPSDTQIAEHLAALGLKPEDRYFFGNDLLAVTDVGATSDNVLLDDSGNLRFIDPLIRLKKPAVQIINTLTEIG